MKEIEVADEMAPGHARPSLHSPERMIDDRLICADLPERFQATYAFLDGVASHKGSSNRSRG